MICYETVFEKTHFIPYLLIFFDHQPQAQSKLGA